MQGIETLEVNKELKDRCEDHLRTAWARAPEQALHCLLFVGTKLVVVHSRPNAFPLAAADIFLLSIYLESVVAGHQGTPMDAVFGRINDKGVWFGIKSKLQFLTITNETINKCLGAWPSQLTCEFDLPRLA